jgi:LITAF-like zinc ribbon domain
MGLFGGKSKEDSTSGSAVGGISSSSPNYVNQGDGDEDANIPVAVPVNVAVAEDSELGRNSQQQQHIMTVAEINKTTYGTSSSSAANNENNNSSQQHPPPPPLPPYQQLEFATRLPTVVSECPHCHTTNVRTTTRTYPSLITWVAVLLVFLIFWPLFWVPLVLDQCRHTTHICSHCHQEIGQVPAFADCCVSQYR